MDDKDKERIKYHTEVLRLCVVIVLTCGGGAITLIIEGDVLGKKGFFVAMGIMISLACTVHGYKSLRHLIKLTS